MFPVATYEAETRTKKADDKQAKMSSESSLASFTLTEYETNGYCSP